MIIFNQNYECDFSICMAWGCFAKCVDVMSLCGCRCVYKCASMCVSPSLDFLQPLASLFDSAPAMEPALKMT